MQINPALERQILGVRFFVGPVEEAVRRALAGGLVVVPSAPNLVDPLLDPVCREALTTADLAIADSGFMVLVWRLLTGEKIERLSGLRYLKRLLEEPALDEPGAMFWVMPGADAVRRLLAWRPGAAAADCYVAPMYPRGGPIEDAALLERIRERRPAHIVIALGAGTQERVGLFLRRECGYRPGLHGVGAAIGFLTGDQVNIPPWADRFYLGWLIRLLRDPVQFWPRLWKAFRVLPLMIRYREQLPPMD